MTSFKRPVTRRFKQPTQSKFQKDTVNSFSRRVTEEAKQEKRGKFIRKMIEEEGSSLPILSRHPKIIKFKKDSPKKELQDESEIYDVNYGCNIPYYKPGNKVTRFIHY